MENTSERLCWLIYGSAGGLNEKLCKQWIWSYLALLL